MKAALRYAAVVLLAVAAAAAPLAGRAGVGLMQLPAREGDGPVTVFYPTASADRPVVRGPFTVRLAENATPARGNGRLVVISHGSGGAPWVHSDRKHCEAHIAEDFSSCAGLATQLRGDMLDGLKMQVTLGVQRVFFSSDVPQSHHDPRIAAVVAGVPFAADFDMDSLAQPRVPLGLVTAGRDRWLVPRFHSDRVLAACRPRCELLAHLPDGGHAALLSPPPPANVLGGVAADLLADPPGFDRAQLAAVDQKIVAFFLARLLP